MASPTPPPKIELRPIQQDDWHWIESWFRDPWLNKELGPVDAEWLTYVLSQTDGIELVALEGGQPVGLIGVTWATKAAPYHGINSLAVDPNRRRTGLGRHVLSAVLRWPGHPEARAWVAFTAADNPPPANLLLSAGWHPDGTQNGMKRFRLIL